MDAIILAGGFGTRLRKVVADVPKPMAMINEKPFLNYLLHYLAKQGVQRVVLATGYLHDQIETFYNNCFNKIKIDYSVEKEPLGTGGAIKQALSKTTTKYVLIINGDTFFDLNIADMMHLHEQSAADLTIALRPMKEVSRYGTVEVEGSRVKSFEEKTALDYGYINGGVYIANRNLFDGFNLVEKFSFENGFLKKFTSKLVISGYVSDAYFIDIGIPEDYQRAQSELTAYE